MRRYRWLTGVLSITLVATAVGWINPTSRYLVLGAVRSEKFYDQKPLSHWVYLLNDGDPKVREGAAFALGEMEGGALNAVPELCAALSDSDEHVRIAAAIALNKMGEKASSATDALAARLNDSSPGVRMNAAIALARFGPKANAAVPALIDALTQVRNYTPIQPFSFSIRQQTARTLAMIGRAARDAVPALIEALHDGQPGVRANAAYALGRIQSSDYFVVAQLRLAMSDEDELVRMRASEAVFLIEAVAKAEVTQYGQ